MTEQVENHLFRHHQDHFQKYDYALGFLFALTTWVFLSAGPVLFIQETVSVVIHPELPDDKLLPCYLFIESQIARYLVFTQLADLWLGTLARLLNQVASSKQQAACYLTR